MEYKNGSLWKKGKTAAVLQKLTDDLFCLLSIDDAGGFSVITDPSQKWQYSTEEVPALLEGWEPVSESGAVTHILGTTTSASTHVASEKIEKPKKAASTRKPRK
jgi:hypothetical protein